MSNVAPTTNGWLSTTKASKALGISARTLYGMIDRGELPAYRFGRVIRLKETEIEEFVDTCRIVPGSLSAEAEVEAEEAEAEQASAP